MLFTNGNYFVFLAAVFFVYWLLASWRLPRVWLLLAASWGGSGCKTPETSDNETSRPWNAPRQWETGLPGFQQERR